MKRLIPQLMFCCMVIFTSAVLFAGSGNLIIREENKIIIDGVEELWRLEWVTAPSPACGPGDEDWYICPCTGFAFGEQGDLDLVRKRPGKDEERFSLSPLFREYGANLSLSTNDAPQAVLRKWNIHKNDIEEKDSPTFLSRVKARPLAQIMKFADYDHDGRATEFVLQVGTLPCGKKMSVVVGISRKNNKLHVFPSVKRPNTPLVLQAWQWESLRRAKGAIKLVHWPCGDHGYNGVDKYELQAVEGNISAVKRQYECGKKGQRAKLIKRIEF